MTAEGHGRLLGRYPSGVAAFAVLGLSELDCRHICIASFALRACAHARGRRNRSLLRILSAGETGPFRNKVLENFQWVMHWRLADVH